MIPKIIHYCWFGGSPMPELAQKCIASWKKYCPDYEIKRWDESNFDFEICDYVKEAYRAKKWAFVSDFARFWILYNYGGIYFDTDVEVLQSIDPIVLKGPFWGRERRNNSFQVLVNTGLGMASEKKDRIYKEIIDHYKTLHFVNEDGTYNKKTVVEYVSNLLYRKGLPEKSEKDNIIYMVEGITIYPWEFFCPMAYETGEITLTKNTYTIHHFTASWKSKEEMEMKKTYDKLVGFLGKNKGKYVFQIVIIPLKIKGKIKEIGFRKTFKLIIKRGKRND